MSRDKKHFRSQTISGELFHNVNAKLDDLDIFHDSIKLTQCSDHINIDVEQAKKLAKVLMEYVDSIEAAEIKERSQ